MLKCKWSKLEKLVAKRLGILYQNSFFLFVLRILTNELPNNKSV